MVQKYSAPPRVHKFPFELVMAAYECRFPTCDMIPMLVSTEIIHEDEAEDKSLHIIERRCKIKIDAPYLIKKIAGVDHVYFVQRNTLDRKNRILKIEAWNESFDNRIIINEYCTYTVHSEDPQWTQFDQSASLEVKSFFGFENAVEKLAAKHYATSIKNSKGIIEVHVATLKEECGVDQVDPWPAPIPEALTSMTASQRAAISRSNSTTEKHHSSSHHHHGHGHRRRHHSHSREGGDDAAAATANQTGSPSKHGFGVTDSALPTTPNDHLPAVESNGGSHANHTTTTTTTSQERRRSSHTGSTTREFSPPASGHRSRVGSFTNAISNAISGRRSSGHQQTQQDNVNDH